MNERERKHSGSSPLRIALLAHGLRVAGGVTVGKGMLAALTRVAPQHTYYVTVPPGLGYEEICQAFPHCRIFTYQHQGSLLHRLHDERSSIPEKVRAFKPDVLWALGNVGVPRPGCPQALLLHNPHRVYPERHAGPIGHRARLIRRLRDRHLARILPDVDMVFCQTETMRRRFIDRYGYKEQVELCPNAGALKEISSGEVTRPDVYAGLEGRFVLFSLTKYYPHKNLEGVVDTFVRHRKELSDCTVLLTIAPEQGKGARRILHAIEKEKMGKMIINLGPVSHQELPGYYGYCQGMILPSFLESFSGTYVEAMQFSTPILTSNLDFAREVCGDAAVYFNPWEPRSIRDAILRLKNETGLADRLIERGKTRLEKFPRSWDEIARAAVKQLIELSRSR